MVRRIFFPTLTHNMQLFESPGKFSKVQASAGSPSPKVSCQSSQLYSRYRTNLTAVLSLKAAAGSSAVQKMVRTIAQSSEEKAAQGPRSQSKHFKKGLEFNAVLSDTDIRRKL
jgi:hypothetical protein